jgi:hypothetical protein
VSVQTCDAEPVGRRRAEHRDVVPAVGVETVVELAGPQRRAGSGQGGRFRGDERELFLIGRRTGRGGEPRCGWRHRPVHTGMPHSVQSGDPRRGVRREGSGGVCRVGPADVFHGHLGGSQGREPLVDLPGGGGSQPEDRHERPGAQHRAEHGQHRPGRPLCQAG